MTAETTGDSVAAWDGPGGPRPASKRDLPAGVPRESEPELIASLETLERATGPYAGALPVSQLVQ